LKIAVEKKNANIIYYVQGLSFSFFASL